MRNKYIIDLHKSEKLVVALNNLISLPLIKSDLSDENILCATFDDALGTNICQFSRSTLSRTPITHPQMP